MSTRGKKATRGSPRRGRGKAKAAAASAVDSEPESLNEVNEPIVEAPEVPELDDGPPPPTISTPVRTSMRLNSTSLSLSHDEENGAEDVQEIVKKKRLKTSETEEKKCDEVVKEVEEAVEETAEAEKDDAQNVAEDKVEEESATTVEKVEEEKSATTVEKVEEEKSATTVEKVEEEKSATTVEKVEEESATTVEKVAEKETVEDSADSVQQVEEVKTDGKVNKSADAVDKEAGENGLATEAIESDDETGKEAEAAVEDAEMVSEDEYFVENKEPLDTEAVSDEELQVPQPVDLPETEAVSDDELPKEDRKKAKVAEAEAVSEDELPEENEKKSKVEAMETEDATAVQVTTEESKVDGKRKLAGGEYDPSSPTSEASQDGLPAAKKVAVGDGKTPKPAKKVLPDLEKYWKAVKDDPSDFTAWTYLLQYVEQENETDVAREAYDAFLEHYPYCYGYWRKYSDFEKRKGNTEACETVFERGLKAIPLSVDLWLHYLNYLKVTKGDDTDYLRAQYERAIDACGLEFRSDRLWESYIKWETEKKNLINITNLYDRLLAIPTQGYTTHFDNFQDHVNGNPPQMILPLDDFLELRREVLQALKAYDKPAASDVQVPGDDAPPGEESSEVDKEDSSVSCTTRMEEETTALRGKILSSRRKIYKATVASVAARWNFEEGIKRPYFHVKPLERCQLKNWKEYLDYEIEQKDRERIITLFERCLIACALYEEFWVRFIRYLETLPDDNTEKIRHVYERACLVHHKKKPNLHLQWAVFEEAKGNYDKAASILESMEQTTPNMLQVAYRRINLERRRGNLARASELYEEYMEGNSGNKAIRTNLTVKFARFKWKVMEDIDGAIAILEKALESDKDNTRLYLQLIDMGLQKNPVDEAKIVGILDQFLEKEGDPEQKLMFAQRKIEFLEDFGTSVEAVHKAQEDFQKYAKHVKEKKKKTEPSADAPAPSPSSTTPIPKVESKSSSKNTANLSTNVPPPTVPPTSAPPPNYSQPGYPPNFYGQYPPSATTAPADGAAAAAPYPNSNYPGYNNYPNWNNYPQGGYGNYGQPGWPGYYPNY